MKNLSYSKKRLKRAVQLATIATGVACTSQELAAAPVFTPSSGVWTVNGTTVTGSGNTSTASFYGSNSAYNVTVAAGSKLSSTSISVIRIPQGTLTNAGTISTINASTSTTSAVYFKGSPAVSGPCSLINTGTISSMSTSFGANGVYIYKTNGNVSVANSGTISATGPFGAGVGVYIRDNTGTATLTNSGTISSNQNGSAIGAFLVNVVPSGPAVATVINSGTISAYSINGQAGGVYLEDRYTTVSGSAYANLVNTGTISAISNTKVSIGIFGVYCSRPQVLNLTNGAQGIIYAQSSFIEAAGIDITPATGIVVPPATTPPNPPNTGTFTTHTATINNQGSITGTSSQLVGYGIADDSTDLLTVTNTGTILGSTSGIFSTTGTTNINLDGGTLEGVSANSASIVTGTVNVAARAKLIAGSGTDLVATGATGQLNLKLVGGTPGQALLARTAAAGTTGSFVFGGYTYSWKNFNVNLQATSLELVAAPQYSNLASKIDNTALPLSYDVFYDAALGNPNAALNELSGFTVIEGMQDLEVNSQNTFLSTVENNLENLDGLTTGGFSTNNLTIGSSTLPGVNSANDELTRLVTYADAKMNSNTSNTMVDNTTADAKDADTKTMAPTPTTEKWTVWLAGGVTLAHEDSLTGAPGYSAVNGSPMLGFDYSVTPDIKTGFLAGATIDGANFGDGTRVDDNTELFGAYASWHHGPWFVDGFVAGGPSQYSDKRSTFGGKTASADPDGFAIDTQVTMGYTFKINQNFNVTPEIGVQYTHLGIDSYSESGAGIFNTNVNEQDVDSLRTHLGGKLDGNFNITSDFTIIPELRAAWYHEYLTTSRGVGTGLAGVPGFNFDVNTLDPDRDYALVGVGLNSIFTGIPNIPMGWFLNYDVQAGQSDYLQHNVTGGMRISF